MLFAPKCLGPTPLSAEALARDRKSCRRFDSCGLGREAVYLGNLFVDRCYYVSFADVRRIFKRVAMSKGGFTGKGVFGSIPYLVVQLPDGSERQCSLKYEEQADELLAMTEREHPGIPTHSEAAERRLREAEEAERARYLKELSPEAQAAVAELRGAQKRLAPHPDKTDALAFAARQKRVIDGVSPSYRFAAAAILLLGIAALAFGVHMLLTGRDYAELAVLFGFAVIFFLMSSRVLPTGRRNRRYAQTHWEQALAEVSGILPEGFPVPAQYAHPIVLERMIRVLREGRAKSVPEAYTVMKDDLRALNASVTVSQKEHDEVVRVKPLFLVCGYRDEV